jgi:hypothetical protein
MRCGSHLYGTATPSSDLDVKGVYLPSAADILLQHVRPTLTVPPARAEGARNAAGDVDTELFSLDRYLALLAAGQTIALDMLFAPDEALLRPPHPLWLEIRRDAPRLVTRRVGSFLSYARRQAAKFGIKGSRLAAARRVLEPLRSAEAGKGGQAKLGRIEPELAELARGEEHLALVDIPTPAGGLVRHLDIGGRRVPLTASVKQARELAEHVIGAYGRRALEAELNEGVDWKALSHAVRVGREALELLATGRIAFPLACAPHLLAVKRGEVPYAEVAAEIERLAGEVEAAAAASALPDEPDRAFIEGLLFRSYGRRVIDAMTRDVPS